MGIFGHGNVAGIGQALLQYRKDFRLYQGRNEQGMVHMATGYAKMKNRLGALAVTTSIGPGATNMITGAATATVNRLPVLCLPSDIFASRRTGPVLQQLESTFSWDYSASDAFKAVSKYWDRINRPDQLPHRAARGDADPDQPGRHRRGHPEPAAGRAGRGVGLSRACCSATADLACAAGPRRPRRAAPRRPAHRAPPSGR